jgi:hypothetical protein
MHHYSIFFSKFTHQINLSFKYNLLSTVQIFLPLRKISRTWHTSSGISSRSSAHVSVLGRATGRVERKPDPQQNRFGCKIKPTPGSTGEFSNPNPNPTGFRCLSGLYMGRPITPESHKSDSRPNTTTPDWPEIDNMKLKLVTSVTTVHKSGMIDLTTLVPIRQTESETSYIEA